MRLPLELIVLGLGAWLFARMTTFGGDKGRYVFWGFVILLMALQIYANFGPSPSSPEANDVYEHLRSSPTASACPAKIKRL